MPSSRIGSINESLRNWVPVFLWATVIFVFSTDIFSSANTSGAFESILQQLLPQLPVDYIERLHSVFRKLGHFTEYFVLGGLLWRALRYHDAAGTRSRRLALSIAITVIYALSDEWHQSFVPSRTASVIDVLIDTVGGICGIWAFKLRSRTRNASPSRR